MKKIFVSIITTLIVCSIPVSANAYVLNNQNVGYTCQYLNFSSASSYYSNLNNATQWNYSGAKVYVKSSNSGYINIYQGFSDVDNGTYGTCYYRTSSQSDIVYYRAFKNASSIEKNETVVHEVGHAIGLSHTQSSNNSISVMRALNFNNKAYPLSDDKAGMNKKY